MFPNSNCLDEHVLSSHRGRLLPFHGWTALGASFPGKHFFLVAYLSLYLKPLICGRKLT